MSEVIERQVDRVTATTDLQPETVVPPADAGAGGEKLHRIVVVGGGAAGLELVTQLGDRLGRRGRASVTLVEPARTHLWKPLLYAVAAGSLNPGEYEVNYLAQAHWHGFRYRFGEMIGLDRSRKEVHLAASFEAVIAGSLDARTTTFTLS
jgi:NADH:quinone reductase (non-electrogenic)